MTQMYKHNIDVKISALTILIFMGMSEPRMIHWQNETLKTELLFTHILSGFLISLNVKVALKFCQCFQLLIINITNNRPLDLQSSKSHYETMQHFTVGFVRHK